MAALPADRTGATSADFKASADNDEVAYNPQSVWGEGIKTTVKVNGHILNHARAFGKLLSGLNSLGKSLQEGVLEVWKPTNQPQKWLQIKEAQNVPGIHVSWH